MKKSRQFTGTVRENITLFDNSVMKDDVIRAAQDACIHEDILKLEGNSPRIGK
ncbi:MAG: hypothetical protein IJS81_05215 [Selenomonadaceae bacterium]|nr:hypothetical protein [Selenomonadaceae bacterium]